MRIHHKRGLPKFSEWWIKMRYGPLILMVFLPRDGDINNPLQNGSLTMDEFREGSQKVRHQPQLQVTWAPSRWCLILYQIGPNNCFCTIAIWRSRLIIIHYMLKMDVLSWTIQEREGPFRLSCRIDYCGYARENTRATQERRPIDGGVHSYPGWPFAPCHDVCRSLFHSIGYSGCLSGMWWVVLVNFWLFFSVVTDIAVACILSGFSTVSDYQTSHSTTAYFHYFIYSTASSMCCCIRGFS